MTVRELCYPNVDVQEDRLSDGLRFTFRAPGSKFGPVQVVLDVAQVLDLQRRVAALLDGESDGQ